MSEYLGMTTWRLTIEALSGNLASRPAIPPVVGQFFGTAASVESSEIVASLGSGELARFIQSLDPVSLQLAIEFAAELRSQFEEAGAFEEAAAIDLAADRLTDQIIRRGRQAP